MQSKPWMQSGRRAGQLLVVLLLLGSLLAGCRSAFWSPDSRFIALDLEGALRLFDVTTGKLTRLDTAGKIIVNPTFSPDGKQLAYYGIAMKGKEIERVDLWTRDLASNEERRIAAEVFPPGGLKSTKGGVPGGLPPGNEEPVGGLTLIMKMGTGPAWSPDGRRIAHIRTLADESGRLELLDVATGQATLPPIMGESQLHASWSPDGKRLAYLAMAKEAPENKGNTPVEVYVAGADGQGSKRVWDAAREPKVFPFGGLQWATDNARLILLATPSKGGDLSTLFATQAHVVSANGGAPQMIAAFSSFMGSVAPSLRSVAYLGGEQEASVIYKPWPFKKTQVLDQIPKSPKPFPGERRGQMSVGAFPHLSYSPDEKRLALVFAEPTGKRQELRLYDLPSGKRTLYQLKGDQAVLIKAMPLAATKPAPVAPPKTAKPRPTAAKGKAKPVAIPQQPDVYSALTAGWKTNLNVQGKPAAEVLRGLAGPLRLEMRVDEEVEPALKQPVTLSMTGRSRLEILEAVAEKAGLYPVFNEEAVGFRPLPRPYPSATVGPFHAYVEEAAQFAGSGTGTVSIRVYGFGLPASAVRLLKDHSGTFQTGPVTGPQGEELYDSDWERGSFSGGDRSFEQTIEVPLKNLVRSVDRVKTLDLTATLTVPTKVATATFEKLAPGTVRKVGAGQIMLKSITGTQEKSLSFETKRIAGKVDLIILDAAGKTLSQEGSSSFSFGEEGNLSVMVRGKPAVVVARVPLATTEVKYTLHLGGLKLATSGQPAQIQPARFPAGRPPVSLTFLGVVGSADFPKLKVRATNHSDKDIRRIEMKADYRDAQGKSLEVKEHSQDAERPFGKQELPVLVPRGKSAEFEVMAFFMPKETRSVNFTVQSVHFSDATIFRLPE